MRNKQVLLVNDDEQESEVIRNVLHDMYGNISVARVRDGREALHALMGTEDSLSSPVSNPDIIILSNTITDVPAEEICHILSNYYRFRHIRFYLLDDPGNIHSVLIDRTRFQGYLRRPFHNDQQTRSKFSVLKPDLDANSQQIALLPFLAVFKNKMLAMSGTISSGVKMAVCVTSVVTLAFTLPAIVDGKDMRELPVVSVGEITPEIRPLPEITAPLEEAVPVEIITQLPTPVTEAAPVSVTEIPAVTPEPEAPRDTVQPKKISIGVRSIKP